MSRNAIDAWDQWKGLDKSLLFAFQQENCRTIFRRAFKSHCVHGRLGVLITKLRSFIEKKFVKVPTQKHVAEFLMSHFNLRNVPASGYVSKFLSGAPTERSEERWIADGWAKEAFQYLLCGNPPTAHLDFESAKPIVEYFFRLNESNEEDAHPAYFVESRCILNAPASHTELAQEIDWITREAIGAPHLKTSKILFWSAGSHFPLERRGERPVAAAIKRAADAGVHIQFLYQTQTDAAVDVKRLLETENPKIAPRLIEQHNHDTLIGTNTWFKDCVDNESVLILLHTIRNNAPDQTLFRLDRTDDQSRLDVKNTSTHAPEFEQWAEKHAPTSDGSGRKLFPDS